MAKVWIVNFAGHDYREAEQFGQLEFVTKGYVSRGSLDRMLYEVVDGLKESAPSDWLLPSGMLILNTLAAGAWLAKHGSLRLLVWDQKTETYRPMEVPEEQILHLDSNLDGSSSKAS